MSTQGSLSGKHILVTGASSGIGSQVAIDCSNEGAHLVITGRDSQRLNETFKKLTGSGHTQIVADLSEEETLKKMVSSLPRINGLVHCAGVLHTFPIKFMTAQKIRETFSVNFDLAVLLVAQLAAQKKIEKEASFVFLSSISAQHPHMGNALYCSAKAALETFSKTVALEFSAQGVRSNCISPGMIKTPMYDKAEEGMSKEIMDQHIAKYLLGVGYPHDVSNTAVFLLSEKSRWITGTNILLDGGLTLGK